MALQRPSLAGLRRLLRSLCALSLVLALAQLNAGCVASRELRDGSGAAGGMDSDGDGVPDAAGSKVPFEPLATRPAVAKAKALTSGGAVTDAELAAVEANPAALKTLVDTWRTQPTARRALEGFFADAFQQSLVSAAGMVDFIGDGSNLPEDALVDNHRRSFAKTAMQLVDEGAPFTQVATTNRYMMTTAMMIDAAYRDAAMADDDGILRTRYSSNNTDKWAFRVTGKRPVAPADSASPASADYLLFYRPGFPNCASAADPYTYNDRSAYAFPPAVLQQLYAVVNGSDFYYWSPGNDAANNQICHMPAGGQPFKQAGDYNDWRMVTVRAPKAGERASDFFDAPTLRAATTLRLQAPPVGYFTTPAFLGQWGTNPSNQARVTANQTLIVGLGIAVDGTSQLPLTSPTAVDAVHAANPGCFACHQTLDPLRQYFRQSYTLSFSQQGNQAVAAVPAAFSHAGVVAGGKGVVDLANIVATHPRFALAWTLKLCAWANSAPCLASDPEIVRIAAAFAASNHQFPVLYRELMASPLVTFTAPTQSFAGTTKATALARRRQFCNILDARLGLTDSCNVSQGFLPPDGTPGAFAQNLPSDAYARGVTVNNYVSAVDPYSRNTYEAMCLLLAPTVVDAAANSFITSTDVPAAIAKLTTNLLGVTAADAPAISAILQEHYNGATAASQSPTNALRSTFVTACSSALLTSIGS